MRTPCLKGGDQEELPHVSGQGQQLRVPGCDSAGKAERSHLTSQVRDDSREEPSCPRGQGRLGGATPHTRPGAVAGRSHPVPKARGGGREEQPQVQGVVAVKAQEGLEEPSHIEGQ